MSADSKSFCGEMPAAMISAAWFVSSLQLSLDMRSVPLLSYRSSVGSARTLGMSVREGPMARMITFSLAVPVPKIKPSDHDIVANLDKAAGADVSQFGIGRRVQVVHFDQADTHRSTLATQHCCVIGGQESRDDCRLAVISRGKRAVLNVSLLGVLPVIVAGDERAVRPVQFEHGVSQEEIYAG